MKKILLVITIVGTALFASSGEGLIKAKCATCHTLEIPKAEMMPSFKAPPMDAVMFHMKDVISDESEMKAFILDYVYNPDASKSVCESHKVQKFGVMPSLKGKVSEKELESISEYMIATYPRAKFVSTIREILRNDKMRGLVNSPFLMNNAGLPHMTKLLIENWDKAKLGLSDNQKSKLLVVRKNTMGGIKKLKGKINELENEIAEDMMDREDINTLDEKIEEVAKMKIEATKIHLKCIADTTTILSDKQVTYLLPFW